MLASFESRQFNLACVAGETGRGEESEKGELGAGDEGTPATNTPFFSFLQPPAAAKF